MLIEQNTVGFSYERRGDAASCIYRKMTRKSDLTESLYARISELEAENKRLRELIAQYEENRDYMRKMQKKGIAEAISNGVRFGRPPIEIPDSFGELAEKYERKEISTHVAALNLGVSTNTFRKWYRAYLDNAGQGTPNDMEEE